MSDFEIQKSVPAPSRNYTGRATKYPWPSMAVNDSIFVAGQTTQGAANRSANVYSLRYGMKFVARTERAGVRIWRIA